MDLYLIAPITRTRTGLIYAAEALQAEALPYMAELSEPARRRACLSGQVGQCSSSHQLSHSSPRMSARTCGRLCAFAPDHPITRTEIRRAACIVGEVRMTKPPPAGLFKRSPSKCCRTMLLL